MLVLAALAVAFAASPAAKVTQLAWLEGYPGVALAIVIGGIVVGLILPPRTEEPAPVPRPDDQNLADSQQRLNSETKRGADAILKEARALGVFIDRVAPVSNTGPVLEDSRPVRAVLLGKRGSGKSTFLARLAAEHATNDTSGPVAMLRFGDWMDRAVAPSQSAKNQFEDWLVNILVVRSLIQRQVARYWVEQDRITVFLDGLDDLTGDAMDDALRGLHQWLADSQNRSVVVSFRQESRDDIPGGLALERWDMPDLDPQVVTHFLDQTLPAYRDLPSHCQTALIEALRRPLWLRFINELPRSAALAECSDAASYTRWLVEQFTRTALLDDVTGDLHRVLHWMATSMHDRGVVTLDLAVPTTLSLPPEGQWLGRTIQGAGLAAGSVPYTLVAGFAAGFGWRAVPMSIAYAAVMVAAGSSRLGKYVIEKLAPPRLLQSRGFRRAAVWERIREAPGRFGRRLLRAAAVGLVTGALLAAGLANDMPDDFDRPFVMWFGIVSMPLLICAFGAFRGALLSGVILALIVGVSGSIVVTLAGGVLAAVVAGLGFAASESGERVHPFILDRETTLGRQLTRSAVASVPYDILSWLLVGLVYGVLMFALSGERVWFDYGFLLGCGGALVFFLVAFSWPPATAYALRLGLRRSGVLRTLTLDEALVDLECRRVLIPVVGGAAFRFFHPVFQQQMRTWTGSERTGPDGDEPHAVGVVS